MALAVNPSVQFFQRVDTLVQARDFDGVSNSLDDNLIAETPFGRKSKSKWLEIMEKESDGPFEETLEGSNDQEVVAWSTKKVGFIHMKLTRIIIVNNTTEKIERVIVRRRSQSDIY